MGLWGIQEKKTDLFLFKEKKRREKKREKRKNRKELHKNSEIWMNHPKVAATFKLGFK